MYIGAAPGSGHLDVHAGLVVLLPQLRGARAARGGRAAAARRRLALQDRPQTRQHRYGTSHTTHLYQIAHTKVCTTHTIFTTQHTLFYHTAHTYYYTEHTFSPHGTKEDLIGS